MRPATTPRRTRILASAAALGAAALLSGCQSLSEQTTDLKYDPADGVSATLGSVQLSDVLIVTSAAGGTGAVSGMATNNSKAPITLEVAAGGSPQSVTVPALSAVRLDGKPAGSATAKTTPVQLSDLKSKPGEVLSVTFKTAGAGASVLEVPVLLDTPPYGTATVTHAPDEDAAEH